MKTLNSEFRFIGLILLLLLVISCGEDSPENVVPIPPEDPVFTVPQTEDVVMYEVNQRAFGPGSDFQAVTQRLDEIQQLNVNVLWLMPVHPIGAINSVNSPYSVKNYKEINPEFGTLAEFKDLIEQAHQRDMAVIIDWVANHTAWDNPWIENKAWYTQDGNGNIVHPPGTNWMDVADLNFDNQDMRLSMIDAMQYWAEEVGVDGFRCDAADMVPYDFWEQALSALNESADRSLIFLAEGARKDHFTAGFQMTYGWDFYSQLKSVFGGSAQPKLLAVTHQSEYAGIPDGARKLRFTTNHDESAWDETPVKIFNGIDGALAASVVSVFMGGAPLIYGSQEVGVEDNVPFFSASTIDWSQNPGMLSEYEKMLDFYSSSETARQKNVSLVEHSKILAFLKYSEQGRSFILVNTRNQSAGISLPDSLVAPVWTNVMTGVDVNLSEQVNLEAYEYLILNQLLDY